MTKLQVDFTELVCSYTTEKADTVEIPMAVAASRDYVVIGTMQRGKKEHGMVEPNFDSCVNRLYAISSRN